MSKAYYAIDANTYVNSVKIHAKSLDKKNKTIIIKIIIKMKAQQRVSTWAAKLFDHVKNASHVFVAVAPYETTRAFIRKLVAEVFGDESKVLEKSVP